MSEAMVWYFQKIKGKAKQFWISFTVMMLAPIALNSSPSMASIGLSTDALINPPIGHSGVPLSDRMSDRTRSETFIALQAGEVSVTGEAGQYVGQVVATGSVDTAWAVLTDYNNFAAFFPDVETSQLLESNGNEKVFEQVNIIRVFPFSHRSRVVISAVESYPQQIAFNVIDGEVKSLQGVWQIEPTGTNQVLVTHRVSIDPGDSPARDLFLNLYKDSLDDTMAAIGQEITRRFGS